MGTAFKGFLARSTALVGAVSAVAGVGIGFAREAEAITVNSVISPAAPVASGQTCVIPFSLNATGTVADSTVSIFSYDNFQVAVTDASGAPNAGIPVNTFVGGPSFLATAFQVSGTGDFSFQFALSAARHSVTGDLFISVFESTGTTASTQVGGPLAQIAIPQSALLAAGGACLNLLPNVAPVANAGPDAGAAGSTVVGLQGSASDAYGDPLTYAWTQTGGPSVSLNNASSLTPNFAAPAKTNSSQSLTFQLIAHDGDLSSSPDSVTITVAANVGPTANAGPDAALTPNIAWVLDGSASSDGDGDSVTYQWTQISGTSVTLTNPTTASPGFTAPALAASAQPLVFELEVSDGLTTSSDIVTLTVPANTAPVANPGANASAGQGSMVTLDASGSSDVDNQTLTYAWTQSGGPSATLNGANTATPNFIVPAVSSPTPLTFELVVNDGIANSSAQTVTITALPNAPPAVNAGPDQSTAGGASVSLSASATDPETDPMTFSWTQTGGPSVTLTGANTATPSFTAPPKAASAQTLSFEFAANDGFSTSTDRVDVVVAANIGATANAGPDAIVAPNSMVTLDGSSSSDGDGDSFTYQWQQASGPSVALSGATSATPSFTAPAIAASTQTLVFDLRVSDGISPPSSDSITIAVPANSAPMANAGAQQSVGQGSAVTLNGAASSDIDNQALAHSWTQLSGPSVALNNANSAAPSFTAPTVTSPTPLVFELVVSDGIASSAPQTVTIQVLPNAAPTVNAGADIAAAGGDSVTLSGSAADPETDPMTFAWTQTAGPSVTLDDPTSLAPSFSSPPKTASVQTLTFSLVANDGSSNSAPDSVDVVIAANVGPSADAGAAQSVNGGALVTLSGAASGDGDGDALTYAWVQTSGPSVVLSDASPRARPSLRRRSRPLRNR